MTNDDSLKIKVETLQKDISYTESKLENDKKDKIAFLAQSEVIKQNNDSLDLTIRDLSIIVNDLNTNLLHTKKAVESTKEYEKEIVEKLAFHIRLENDMAAELLKYRGIVAEARSTYQKFFVKRIWLIVATQVTLVLQKGPDGKHVLQINDGKKTDSYKIAEVDSVFMHPNKGNRFFLRVYGEDDQEYETENAIKIMELIRELIFSDFNDRE